MLDFIFRDLDEKDMTVDQVADLVRRFQRGEFPDDFKYGTSHRIAESGEKIGYIKLEKCSPSMFSAILLRLCKEVAERILEIHSLGKRSSIVCSGSFLWGISSMYDAMKEDCLFALTGHINKQKIVIGFAQIEVSCNCHTHIRKFQSFVPREGYGSKMLQLLEKHIRSNRGFPRMLSLCAIQSATGFWSKMGCIEYPDSWYKNIGIGQKPSDIVQCGPSTAEKWKRFSRFHS